MSLPHPCMNGLSIVISGPRGHCSGSVSCEMAADGTGSGEGESSWREETFANPSESLFGAGGCVSHKSPGAVCPTDKSQPQVLAGSEETHLLPGPQPGQDCYEDTWAPCPPLVSPSPINASEADLVFVPQVQPHLTLLTSWPGRLLSQCHVASESSTKT